MNRDGLKPQPKPPQPEPSGGRMTAEKFSEIAGVSVRHLRRIAKEGYFPAPDEGVYQTGPALVGFIKYQGDLLKKKTDTLRQEQEMLTRAKRKTAEAELEKFLGTLIPKEEILPQIQHIAQHLNGAIGHVLEREVPPRLEGRNPVERLAVLKTAADDLRRILRTGIEPWTKTN